MTPARTVARTRLAAVVVAILLITAAAIGNKLSDVDSSYELVRAPLGEATRYQTGTVRVSDVQVGTRLDLGNDRLLETKGLFVVVNVAVRATGRDDVRVADERLLADGGMVYSPAFSSSTVAADAGFESVKNLVFEVDPARMDGLVLELWNAGIIFRYYERTQTPLGITADNADQWVRAGAGQVVVQGDTVTTGLG